MQYRAENYSGAAGRSDNGKVSKHNPEQHCDECPPIGRTWGTGSVRERGNTMATTDVGLVQSNRRDGADDIGEKMHR